MNLRARLFVAVFGLALAGCPKDKPPEADAGAGAAPTASSSAGEAGAEAGPASSAASYEGTYTASPGTLSIPDEKEYARVKQAPDDGTKMVGEGKLTLKVDEAGRLSGSIDSGPAAKAAIDGTLSDKTLTGRVRRVDPSDQGLSGTLFATVEDGSVSGTMKLSDGNAGILREAKLSAKKK